MNEYLYEMDFPMTIEACRYAGIPKEIIDDIWKKEKKPGFNVISTTRKVV